MIITCIAHAMFLLELENGMRIVTDPCGESSGYPMKPVSCDAVLISHEHHDHSDLSSVTGYSQIIRTEGTHTLAPDVRVTALSAFHDSMQGAARGKTLLFVVEAEGLRVAHLGDLGHLPNEKQHRFLQDADIMMLPIGGHFTIDAKQAYEVAEGCGAKVILPMHYRTEATHDWPITPVDGFLSQYPAEDVAQLPLVRITGGDLACQKHVIVLEPQYQRMK